MKEFGGVMPNRATAIVLGGIAAKRSWRSDFEDTPRKGPNPARGSPISVMAWMFGMRVHHSDRRGVWELNVSLVE